MAGWKYAPVGDEEQQGSSTPAPSQRGCMKGVRTCLNSRLLWRSLTVIAIVLLAGNLFFPARDELRKYGYFLEKEQKNAIDSADVLNSPAPIEGVNWSDYAYCQYVTNEDYLCNSVMIFESLSRLGAKADKIMMYPEEWSPGDSTHAAKLLTKARDEYGVHLVPIEVQHFSGEITWADSFTKLLAFNQTQYKRVLSMDSDATVLQPMDELFLLPEAPVAMPRAYWLDDTLSSQLVLIQPSEFEFKRIQDAFENRASSDFDMEIVNDLYGNDCFIIPHRRYDLLTGEFKGSEHSKYLGSIEEKWDGEKILNEAKFVHFSDWPYPKPWINAGQASTEANQPKCPNDQDTCPDRKIWLGFYEDFRDRRQKVCAAPTRLAKREDLDVRALGPPSKYEPISW